MRPLSLAQRALENRRREQLAKVLPRKQPKREHVTSAVHALVDALAAAGKPVTLVMALGWSRHEQAEAYLWASGQGPLPACLDPTVRAIAKLLRDVRMYVCDADVVRWSKKQREQAIAWAALFAGGREDLPPPPHVYEAARL